MSIAETESEVRYYESVEAYIRDLPREGLTDTEFTLIAGNIRGYASHIRKQVEYGRDAIDLCKRLHAAETGPEVDPDTEFEVGCENVFAVSEFVEKLKREGL